MQKTWKINLIKRPTIILKISKKRGESDSTEILLTQGEFFTPITTTDCGDLITPATLKSVANATMLMGCPIYVSAKNHTGIKSVISKYCTLLGLKNFSELQSSIPNGVVVYTYSHSRLVEELRTVDFLRRSDKIAPMSAWDFGYHEIYEFFIKPKLFRDGNIVPPEEFKVNFITGSYSNRIIDIAMGMVASVLTEMGVDPEKYLSQCYALNLIANPYNFSSSWKNATDWRKPVLHYMPTDVVWNFTDIATRVKPEHDLLLTQLPMSDNNRILLKDSDRQAIIVVPSIRNNFEDLSDAEIGPAILGHDLLSAIEAICTEEKEFIDSFRKYIFGKLSIADFGHQSINPEYTYLFDPTVGIALGEIINVTPMEIVRSSMLSPILYIDLFAIICRIPFVNNPAALNNKIVAELKARKLEITEDQMLFWESYDWLMSFDEYRSAALNVIQTYEITKTILEMAPKTDDVIAPKAGDTTLFNHFASGFVRLFYENNELIDQPDRVSFLEYLKDENYFQPDEVAVLEKSEDMPLEFYKATNRWNSYVLETISQREKAYIDFLNIKPYTKNAYSYDSKSIIDVGYAMFKFSGSGPFSEDWDDMLRRKLGEYRQILDNDRRLRDLDVFDVSKKLNAPVQLSSEIVLYKYSLLRILYHAAHDLLLKRTIDEQYCSIVFEPYTLTTSLKARAANLVYKNYLKECHEKNSGKEPSNKFSVTPYYFFTKPQQKVSVHFKNEYDIRNVNHKY